MKIDTMPNRIAVETAQIHELSLPQCCPVSKNPQPGSYLKILYQPKAHHLEVYALRRYIDSFVGGQKCPYSGAIVNRDMESMIQAIAQVCADSLGVSVKVRAYLILEPSQIMRLVCKANPHE